MTDNFRRQFSASDARDDCSRLLDRQVSDCQRNQAWTRWPRCRERRTVSQEQENRSRRDLFNKGRQELQRRWIDPVQILNREQQRLSFRSHEQHFDQGLDRFLFAAFRCAFQSCVMRTQRNSHEVNQQWNHRFQRNLPVFQQAFQLRKFRLIGVPGIELCQPFQQLTDRIKSGVLLISRTGCFNHLEAALIQPLPEGMQQAGFPDARIRAQKHDLAQPAGGLFPASIQKTHFMIAADERSLV